MSMKNENQQADVSPHQTLVISVHLVKLSPDVLQSSVDDGLPCVAWLSTYRFPCPGRHRISWTIQLRCTGIVFLDVQKKKIAWHGQVSGPLCQAWSRLQLPVHSHAAILHFSTSALTKCARTTYLGHLIHHSERRKLRLLNWTRIFCSGSQDTLLRVFHLMMGHQDRAGHEGSGA